MKITIAILTLIAGLAGCAGFDSAGNPRPFWIGENICIGSGCPGAVRAPDIAASLICNNQGSGCYEILPPGYLYREDEEKPVIVKVEYAEGRFMDVAVYDRKCRVEGSRNASYDAMPSPAVYLCNNPRALQHELDHAKGFRHTEWVFTGVANCATVTEAGYKTKYKTGQRICVAPNGYEFVDSK